MNQLIFMYLLKPIKTWK